jgi:hypothetical protein
MTLAPHASAGVPATGYTRPEVKRCIRCGFTNGMSALYRLCDDCRQDDIERKAEEKDRQDLITFARQGF